MIEFHEFFTQFSTSSYIIIWFKYTLTVFALKVNRIPVCKNSENVCKISFSGITCHILKFYKIWNKLSNTIRCEQNFLVHNLHGIQRLKPSSASILKMSCRIRKYSNIQPHWPIRLFSPLNSHLSYWPYK